MTAIEEMAGMDVLCSDKTGTLTLNKLTVDKSLIEVFVKGLDKEQVMLLAAWASRTEYQDAIDAAIVGMLADPKEARAGIREVHFLPFNPLDKRTALTYIDSNENWHRASKGAPEQILQLCHSTEDVRKKVHVVIDKFAERGLRSLGVARQEVPEKSKESLGGPWQLVGLLPLFDPPRHDSAETIKRALNLGVNVKMVAEDDIVNDNFPKLPCNQEITLIEKIGTSSEMMQHGQEPQLKLWMSETKKMIEQLIMRQTFSRYYYHLKLWLLNCSILLPTEKKKT
ncbi:hypothetical protein SASPL_148696 [Salvia splendens]|uniref:Plasma membrane ATPase n=1 Tax=Salvia splendens TaxID=180675 RepID=A0A8X8WAB2_SALSN|nr:hypothetical protein SASPL_148696 [Salvia splendens]